MSASTLATIGILSIGDMGMGIAKLLVAKNFSVATNCAGRRYALKDTLERVKAAQVADLATDTALVKQCDVILSVVPPRDAEATAQRIIDALALVTRADASRPLYFVDLNAVAPSTIKRIQRKIEAAEIPAVLVDGSILGGPPHLVPVAADDKDTTTHTVTQGDWNVPSLPTSGPTDLASVPGGYGAALTSALNMRHISPAIGAASGLKMCFASLSKGYSAIAVQSFTTAERLGVLPALRDAMAEIVPGRVAQTERALTGMPPKAYRWVAEMEEIATTHREEGGFEADLFKGAAGVFRAVAEDSVLGAEKVGQRKRGLTGEDVAVAMKEGMEKKRKKLD
ncbi:6-phosphogluconate dehydrogenase [Coniella lustricola]|uniref:6-phosphogluconate dehydrogenase n=1 Tax=Coniella lustricola TaxID=2025994 RepID=A0A2T3A0Y9_9PEZI|nr:6-phosphogluconate dehydrogenase [Coniella lustricola]